jgi:polygalacturonase
MKALYWTALISGPIIRNIIFLPTGRIKFGTESNGGFKNITISNCVFEYCRGLSLETVDGALLEDVTIDNITMRDIVNDPIFLRLASRMRAPAGTPVGKLQRIMISNVEVYNANSSYACTISGIPGHNIEDVQLNDIFLYFPGGGALARNAQIPEKEDAYPEPGMFGNTGSGAFFVRHVNNLQLNNIMIYHITKDKRPPFIFDGVSNVSMINVISDGKKIDK